MDLSRFYIPAIIIMAFSAMFWPFAVTVLIYLACLIAFENFYPGIIILFMMDAVYSLESFHAGPVYGLITIGGVMLFLLIDLIKGNTALIRK